MRRRIVVRMSRPAVSRLFDVRVSVVLAAAALLAVLVGAYSMTLGDFPVPLREVFAALAGAGSGEFEFIVVELRLPRVAVAVLAGAAMGLSGAIFQSFARNPLVSPDIIGVNTGAGLVAVAILTTYPGRGALVPVGAFAGAVLAAVVVYLSARTGRLSPYRMVLIGIGVDAFCRAGISLFLVQSESTQAQTAVLWMVGSLHAADLTSVRFLLVACVVLVPAAMALRRPLSNLQLGDDAASALGTRVERARIAILVVAVLLAASAVAVCGPVAFVAFIAPHLARRVASAPGPAVFPAAAAAGALLFLISDHVAHHVLPVALPLGVITPLIGGPYFLYLLLRMNRREGVT